MFKYHKGVPETDDPMYCQRIQVHYHRAGMCGFLWERKDRRWDYYYPRGGPMRTYNTLEEAKAALELYYEEYW